MRPIVIAGPSANTGKTELACRLIAALAYPQALKITRFHRESHCPVHGADEHGEDNCDGCGPAPSGFELVTDDTRLREPGKDSDRMLNSGAMPVRWLRSAPHVFDYAISRAMMEFDATRPLVIEGNSAACVHGFDALVVVIWPQVTRGVKASVIPALKRCNLLLLVEQPSGEHRVPSSLRQACARGGVDFRQLPSPIWLFSDWWKNPGLPLVLLSALASEGYGPKELVTLR
jgi:hypothetical protein